MSPFVIGVILYFAIAFIVTIVGKIFSKNFNTGEITDLALLWPVAVFMLIVVGISWLWDHITDAIVGIFKKE
jgi:CBS domain containing-hemolysin-like protein